MRPRIIMICTIKASSILLPRYSFEKEKRPHGWWCTETRHDMIARVVQRISDRRVVVVTGAAHGPAIIDRLSGMVDMDPTFRQGVRFYFIACASPVIEGMPTWLT